MPRAGVLEQRDQRLGPLVRFVAGEVQRRLQPAGQPLQLGAGLVAGRRRHLGLGITRAARVRRIAARTRLPKPPDAIGLRQSAPWPSRSERLAGRQSAGRRLHFVVRVDKAECLRPSLIAPRRRDRRCRPSACSARIARPSTSRFSISSTWRQIFERRKVTAQEAGHEIAQLQVHRRRTRRRRSDRSWAAAGSLPAAAPCESRRIRFRRSG